MWWACVGCLDAGYRPVITVLGWPYTLVVSVLLMLLLDDFLNDRAFVQGRNSEVYGPTGDLTSNP